MSDGALGPPDPVADGRPLDPARGSHPARSAGGMRGGRIDHCAWSPSSGLVGLAWAATAVAVAWCVLAVATGDRVGLLLAAVAAVGLGLAALYGTRARPRLRVDGAGLTVGGLSAARHHPWRHVGPVRVLTVRRLGRASTLLEIDVTDPDGAERLLVFGRLDLDEDPEDVAAVVRAARPA